MIVDMHTHIYDEEVYQMYMKRASGRVDKILSIYYWGIIGGGRTERFTFEDMLRFAAKKENVYVIAAVNTRHDIPMQLKEIEELLKEKKVFGIKMYPGYQHFEPSDERVFPVADLCVRYNKPLLFHSGTVYDSTGGADLRYAHPIFVDRLAMRFPKCKIIIAHFGFPYFLETASLVSKNANVYTEISGTIDSVVSESATRDLLRQYTYDVKRALMYFPEIRGKIMFGTDYGGEDTPLNQIDPYIKLVKSVFSRKEQQHVFAGLAENLFFSS